MLIFCIVMIPPFLLAMDAVFVCPQNSFVEAPVPDVMVFGGGGLWEIIRVR